MKVMHCRCIGLVLLIDGPVATRHLERQVGIQTRECVQRLTHHVRDQRTNVAQFPIARARPFDSGHVHGDGRDLLALVTDPLQIRNGLQYRNQQP